jgi:solute carrier family 25 (adenine nucleotide translocator) protein 4/5/6/31
MCIPWTTAIYTRVVLDVQRKDGNRHFSGMLDVYKQTLKNEGLARLYRGFAIACAGVVVYRGCYFGFHDTLHLMMQALMREPSFAANWALEYAVTVCVGLISHSVDTARRRMMMTRYMDEPYKKSLDYAATVVKKMGIVFQRSLECLALRVVSGGTVLALMTSLKHAYVDYHRV